MKKNDPFSLTSPCKNCPFRTDNGFILTNARVKEIVNSLLMGQTFPCHKTCTYEDGETIRTSEEKHCAGGMIMLEHIDRPNQMMRIGERLGMYFRHKLDMTAPVFKSPAEMISAYQKRNAKPKRKTA